MTGKGVGQLLERRSLQRLPSISKLVSHGLQESRVVDQEFLGGTTNPTSGRLHGGLVDNLGTNRDRRVVTKADEPLRCIAVFSPLGAQGCPPHAKGVKQALPKFLLK